MDFGDFLDTVEGLLSIYCVECYSKEELQACLDILDDHGWEDCGAYSGVFDREEGCECVTIWLYCNEAHTSWNDTTYDAYCDWHEKEFGQPDNETIDEVYHFADFVNTVTESVDTAAFDEFISSL